MRILRKRALPRLHFAASESDADMLYATGFFAPDAFWYLEHKGKKFIFLNELEIDRARKVVSEVEVLSFSEIEKTHRAGRKRFGGSAFSMGKYLKRLGLNSVEVPPSFPLGVAAELARCGVLCRPTKGAFFPEREIKAEREIQNLAEAQRAAQAAMWRAREILRECKRGRGGVLCWGGKKLDSTRLRGELQTSLARHGASCQRLIVAGGNEACDPHEIGSGPLRADEMIIVDIFPRMSSTGYWGDITRTFCVGQPRTELAALHAAVLEAQKLALGKIRDGCDGNKLQESVKQEFFRKGYITGVQDGRNVGFFHGLGHGIGLDIHESPRFSDGILRTGQTVTVEPGLYYPGLGGVRIEDLVVVTECGCKNLTSFPKDWRVK